MTASAPLDLTKNHQYMSDYRLALRGDPEELCICGLPSDNPMHLKVANPLPLNKDLEAELRLFFNQANFATQADFEASLRTFTARLTQEAEKQGALKALDLIAEGEGWEESKEHYRKLLKENT